MKKIIVYTLLLFTIYSAKAQVNNLYLIQAHTFDDLGGMFQFCSLLYKLNNHNLDTVVVLSTEKEFLYAVKAYPQYKKIVLYKNGWKDNNEKRIAIIDYNNVDQVYWKNINYKNYGIIDGNFVKSDDNYFVLDLYGRKETPKSIFFGISINGLKEINPSASIYKSVILSGAPGGVMRGEDYLMVYTNESDGKLYIPKTSKIEERPVFPLEIPDSLQLKEKKRVLILTNNDENFVVAMEKSEPNPKGIGFTKLVLKDKIMDDWFSFMIKGNCQIVRSFGSWLAGLVVDDNFKLILDEKGTVKDKDVFYRISPGKEARRKVDTETGTTFDQRAEYIGVYYPGILYLLNISTKKYIEWNTGQGDSEILLVQDDIVYYRVNDQIFRASIVNGSKIGESELLVKDYRVPDIHWAFISK